MFCSKFICASCGYESQTFVEGGIGCDSYLSIRQNKKDHKFRFVNVDKKYVEKVKHDKKLDDEDIDQVINSFDMKDDELLVVIDFGVDETLDLICPSCNKSHILKKVVGLH